MRTKIITDNTIVITDLDGTLTKGSLVLEHCGHLESLGIIDTKGAFENWNKDKKNEKLITECAISYQSCLQGLELKELDVKNFVKQFLNDTKNWYETIVELEGRESFIVSGSADFLVQELVKQINEVEQYEQVKGFGSVYEVVNNKLTGKIEKAMFHADAKREQIKEIIGQDKNYIIGMGDTFSDKSIFEVANYNILVEPTKETLENLLTTNIKIDRIVRA
ncbi:MAG: HAD family hydrolase [Sarcina sp.]